VNRTSRWLNERLDELRASALSLVLVAGAASLSWFIAREVFEDDREAFFAPVAAILTLGLTVGQRGRRAWEIGLGVALGIGIADVIVLLIGTGAWQLGVVVLLAMAGAVLAGGGVLLVNQAAISGALVVTLSQADGFSGVRFLDALIGSAVALLANALIPSNPLRMVRDEANPLLHGLADALERVADGLERHDIELARDALARARGLDPKVAALREALLAGRETTMLAPTRRQDRPSLDPYSHAVDQLDHAVRNTRVLARRSISAIEVDDRVPESVFVGIRELAAAVPSLGTFLSDPGSVDEVEQVLVGAAAAATTALEVTGNLSANVIVGQVRAIAADLLGVLGMGDEEAREAVRAARVR
jgi:uncharacterized membrane protein YgaE (UPF0421/DUF939 family)